MTSPDKKTTSTPPPPPSAAKGPSVAKGPPQGPPPGVPVTAATTSPIPSGTNGAAASQTNSDAGSDTKEPNRSKYFVVVGKVHEFTSAAQAEKFLNEPGAPAEFSVVRGHRVKSKQRVSLR